MCGFGSGLEGGRTSLLDGCACAEGDEVEPDACESPVAPVQPAMRRRAARAVAVFSTHVGREGATRGSRDG